MTARAVSAVRRLAAEADSFPARKAEVEDLDSPVRGHEQVLGLQIAVDDALVVRGGEAIRDLRPQSGASLRIGSGAAIQARAQRLAFEQLHDGERDAVLLSELVDGEDVGMREGRDRLGFALEARPRRSVRGEPGWQNLDRDLPPEPGVGRPVHLAHPAGTERRDDLDTARASFRSPCASTAAASIMTAARP